VEGLEDEADVAEASAVEGALRLFCQVAAGDSYLTGVGPIEAAQEVKEGGLPAPGRTEDSDDLICVDLQADFLEDAPGPPTGPDGLRNAASLQNRHATDGSGWILRASYLLAGGVV
jgi:hypothetical protein